MSDTEIAPPEFVTIHWQGQTLEYKLQSNGQHRDSIAKPKTPRGEFQERMMDEAGYLIPSVQSTANKRFYTPMQNILRQVWFTYLVTQTGKATNSDFKKRYAKFDTKMRYGEYAFHAVLSVIKAAQKKMDSQDMNHDAISSLEKTAIQIARKGNHIMVAIRMLADQPQISDEEE